MKKRLNDNKENDIMSMAYVREIMNQQERNKILNNHAYDIYEQADGKWATYVPSTDRGRVLKRRKSREELEDCIVEYYKKNMLVSVKQLFYEWVNEKLEYGEIQKQTHEKYIYDFNRYIANTNFANMDIATITEDILEHFIKTTIRDNHLTNKAYSGLRIILRGTFKYAKKHKYTDISITSFFGDLDLSSRIFTRKPKIDASQVFTDNEVRMIKEYILEHISIINLGVLLTFYTGLRIGEIAGLKKEDFAGDKLFVRRTEVRYRTESGKYMFEVRDSTKTEAGERVILLNRDAIKILKRVRLMNPFGEYLFENNGKRIKSHNYGNAIVRICEKLGIPKRSMHKARKTYATKLLDGNVSERLIILQMGHSDIDCTKNFYYFNNKEEEEAREEIEKALNY